MAKSGPKPRTLEERFWPKVQKTEGCWPWLGALDPQRYGMISRGGHQGPHVRAHRVAYELLVGPIPKGLTLDHNCHNIDEDCPGGKACLHRRCVRPDHLTPRSAGQNTRASSRTTASKHAAKTHCPQGHPYAGYNLLIYSGKRECWTCRRLRRKAAAARRKVQAQLPVA